MRFLKEILLENWGLKLTAVLLATVLWQVVRNDSSSERIITVPLEVRIPRNMEITNDRPSSVEVTVRGSSGNMWFGQPLPACTIDLQSADEGEHIVPLTPENIRIPRTSGLVIGLIRPARLYLVLEKTISREVAVAVPIRGEPAPDYEIYHKAWLPATVIIGGPRSHVEKLKEISTEAVSVAGLTGPVRTFANLNIRDNSIHTSPVGPVEVKIEVGVRRRLYTVNRVPVSTPDAGLAVNPSSISVELLVPVTYKRSLTSADLSATVANPNFQDSKTQVAVKPEVKLKAEQEGNIVIKNTRPAEVVVRRIGKN